MKNSRCPSTSSAPHALSPSSPGSHVGLSPFSPALSASFPRPPSCPPSPSAFCATGTMTLPRGGGSFAIAASPRFITSGPPPSLAYLWNPHVVCASSFPSSPPYTSPSSAAHMPFHTSSLPFSDSTRSAHTASILHPRSVCPSPPSPFACAARPLSTKYQPLSPSLPSNSAASISCCACATSSSAFCGACTCHLYVSFDTKALCMFRALAVVPIVSLHCDMRSLISLITPPIASRHCPRTCSSVPIVIPSPSSISSSPNRTHLIPVPFGSSFSFSSPNSIPVDLLGLRSCPDASSNSPIIWNNLSACSADSRYTTVSSAMHLSLTSVSSPPSPVTTLIPFSCASPLIAINRAS